MRRSTAIVAVLVTLCTPSARAQSTYEQLQAFSGLLNQIRLSYVDSVTYGELVNAAIEGVLRSLDPHSYFISREDMARRSSFEAGELAGTGIELDDVDNQAVVVALAPGSPAARAGLQPGDRLLEMNDTTVAGVGAQKLQNRMIGDKGTRLRLRLERGSRLAPNGFTVNLKFDVIPARSVLYSAPIDAQTGYIRLLRFYPDAEKEVLKALKKLDDQHMKRLVLDLRFNPGGLIASATEVAGLFLNKDIVILRMVGRTPIDNQEFRTKGGPYSTLPLIVLINEHTASAAEALAGLFQDLDRAVIVGRRSFGKALAQRPIPIPPRGDVVWLTVARVTTPSGRSIQRPYRNLTAEQYERLAGKTTREADSGATFHTAAGRPVRAGEGVTPDVELGAPPPLPAWWAEATSDWGESLVDSIANTLDQEGYVTWKTSPAEWRTRLARPLLGRVHDKLGIEVRADSLTTDRIAWVTAYRATEVRWGTERAYDFALTNDGELRAAVKYFDKLSELLKK